MPFIKAGDLNVHYTEKGRGEPVIFVHGNWVTLATWEPVLALLPEGWRGVAYDVRGRGKTEGPDSDYTLPELAADLHAFALALGLERFDLVGHSLGSAIAMEFTLEHPDMVRSLTALAPAWVDGMPEAMNVPAGQQAIKANKALFAQALKALAPTGPDDDLWKRIVDEGHEQRLTAALKNIDALLVWKPGDRLKETGVPSLVVDGALDILTGGANAVRTAEAMGAEHIVMPGVGHSPNIEAPAAFVDVLMRFLSSVDNGRD